MQAPDCLPDLLVYQRSTRQIEHNSGRYVLNVPIAELKLDSRSFLLRLHNPGTDCGLILDTSNDTSSFEQQRKAFPFYIRITTLYSAAFDKFELHPGIYMCVRWRWRPLTGSRNEITYISVCKSRSQTIYGYRHTCSETKPAHSDR